MHQIGDSVDIPILQMRRNCITSEMRIPAEAMRQEHPELFFRSLLGAERQMLPVLFNAGIQGLPQSVLPLNMFMGADAESGRAEAHWDHG